MLEWRTPGSPEAVERALDLLLKARRPLVLAGGGVILSDASKELAAFAEHVNVPVYSSFMGKGVLSAKHPLHLGIAPREIGRNYPTEIGIVGDAREVLRQLLELAEKRGPKRERSPWNDQVEAYKEEWSNFIEPEKASDAVPIDPRPGIKELPAAPPGS